MSQRYMILRSGEAAATRSPFDVNIANAPDHEAFPGAFEPNLEVQDLDAKEVLEIANEVDVSAIAPIMPTKLIAPEAAAEVTTAWGIEAIKADVTEFDGAGVITSILDTGVDANHPAFAGVTFQEQDFTGSGNGDRQGHGTHCAGTVFGRNVDGTRIGVAPGVTNALIGKVLGDDGRGDSQMLFDGMQWAARQGANVISMSLGFDFPGMVQRLVDQGLPADFATSRALEAYRANIRMFDAIMLVLKRQVAFGPGVVVVAAAGNESKREIDPDYEIAASVPAAAEGIISVGALGEGAAGFVVADFSNTFPRVAAPGVGILSARANADDLVAFNGTSMACPHVAGTVALWWQAVRAMPVPANASTVEAKLLASARTDAIADEVDIADRGLGIVTAP